MIATGSTMDPEVRQVEELLQRHFQNVECYRYNSVSIRARVRDDRFRGKSQSEREAIMDEILEELPEEVRQQLLLLLLLPASGPRSLTEKLLNKEFEHPQPSAL
jgi:hypothetical protein